MMSSAMTIIVYGTPAPQGSKRFIGVAKKTGRGVMIESSKKVKPWREDVRNEALRVRAGAAPLDLAVRVRMVFTLPKPSSAPKKRKTFPMRKPDLSKLARSTEDALVEAGILADDARIVGYERLEKVYPSEDPEALDAPGVLIIITPIQQPKTIGQGDLLTTRAA